MGTTKRAGTEARRRRGVSRRAAVLLLLAGGALLLALSLPEWAGAPVRTTIGTAGTASVSGSEGAPLVPGLALVVLVAGLAIGLAGRVTRVIAAVAAALGSAAAVAAVVAFLRDPATPVQSAAADMTGVRELGGVVTTTAWPYLALAVGVFVAVIAAILPWRMGQWQATARRYERDPAPPGEGAGPRVGRMADWDALSRGEDPSDR